MRHQHKYITVPLPPHHRFWFRTDGDLVAAATLEEFVRQLRHSDLGTVAHHMARGDFSRWITGIFADVNLGTQLAAIERDLGQRHAAELERARQRVIHAIDNRYLGRAAEPPADRTTSPEA